jgi:hypothetical protein
MSVEVWRIGGILNGVICQPRLYIDLIVWVWDS